MFERERLIGSKEREIVLQTRLGNPVKNSQAPAPDAQSIKTFEYLLSKHKEWVQRSRPCGIYNCFGHVWASRRTAIYEQPEIDTILRDDGYRLMKPDEHPKHGDLALYYDPTGEYLWHAGLVCEFRGMTTERGESLGLPAPWVLSKLCAVSGEVLHHARQVHFPDGDFILKFWTDRPSE